MPSPFPGMDPYLEAPSIWPNVHQSLITYARDLLTPLVRPRYWIQMGERVYPDIALTSRSAAPSAVRIGSGATAVAETADIPLILIVPAAVVREVFLEIRDARSRHVITVIEILSPANKARGDGYDLYREKQRQVLESDASLVEVDLLRRGEPTVAAPADSLYSLPAHHYRVCVSRPDDRKRFEVYAFRAQERLPRVGIPLRTGEPDVILDLPALLARAYDNGAYADVLDYTLDPDPPFSGDDAEWVRSVARTATTGGQEPSPLAEQSG